MRRLTIVAITLRPIDRYVSGTEYRVEIYADVRGIDPRRIMTAHKQKRGVSIVFTPELRPVYDSAPVALNRRKIRQ